MFVRTVWFCIALLGVLSATNADAASSRVSYENAPLNNQPSRKIWGELKTPDGSGPFPAVLVLQPCGGLNDTVTLDWPKYLNELGHAAFIIDILGSRNVQSACSGNVIALDERMRDVYCALRFLKQHAAIDPQRIYMIGFSWGGEHVLEALLERRLAQFGIMQPAAFKGGVAVYPECKGIAGAITQRNVTPAFYAPALIIGGELDDWTPISHCRTIVTGQRRPAEVRLEVMPGAHHGFDQFFNQGRGLTTRKEAGHTLAPNHAATNAARALVKDFLANPQ